MDNDSIQKKTHICIVDGKDLCVRACACVALLMIPGG